MHIGAAHGAISKIEVLSQHCVPDFLGQDYNVAQTCHRGNGILCYVRKMQGPDYDMAHHPFSRACPVSSRAHKKHGLEPWDEISTSKTGPGLRSLGVRGEAGLKASNGPRPPQRAISQIDVLSHRSGPDFLGHML